MCHLLRSWLAGLSSSVAFVTAALAFAPLSSRAADLVIAEPVHGFSFSPVYIAMRKGYFKDEGIDVKLVTMTGTNFVTAVLNGEAFAFLGSVDHNAFAAANGKTLKAVSALVAHANIYLMARKDLMPVTTELAAFLKGKRIATSSYGRTPNNMLRYLLATKWHLEPGRDVTLLEVDSNVILPTVGARQADVGVTNEPFISMGVKQGIWGQPIYDAATGLGPYTDTAVSVRGDSIEKEPKLVKGLVKAVVRGLVYTNTHRDELVSLAAAEFPIAAKDDLEAMASRAFADDIFSHDGYIPPEAWATGEAVVRQPGILKKHVGYDEVIDMRFVKEVQKELGIN
jgi:NitT/TauT family transport system substrate-binding protein